MRVVPDQFVSAYSWLASLPAFAASFDLIHVHVHLPSTFQQISSLITSQLKVVVVVVTMMMWLLDLKDKVDVKYSCS
jgi:hypothetical protein